MAVGPVISAVAGIDRLIPFKFEVAQVTPAVQSDVVLQEKDNIAVRHFCTPQSLG